MVSAPEIPGHRVAGVLGTGGFATVYRAWQIAVGREVAVKVDNRVLLTERDRRRFVREVTAAGRLSGHPHVIDVYDAGTLADGRPYLVMELCPGGSLSDVLDRRGPMSAAQVRDIGIRISDALAAAHAAGVLHRDIKPANILVNRYGMVGLSDFGLASIMAAGGKQSTSREALTPAYASPETFRGEEPTVAADVYSLAATLYDLLAGRPPHFPDSSEPPDIATIIRLHGKPVDDVPGVPPALMTILRHSLAADPAARPPSAAALRDALAAPPGRPAQAAGQPRPRAMAPPARPAVPAGARVPGAARVPRAARVPGPAPSGSGPGGVPAGTAATTSARRRPVVLALAAAGLVVLIGAAALVGARVLPHGASAARAAASRGDPGATPTAAPASHSFGIPTVTGGCPAVSVPAAGARCPRHPECWNGLVEIPGSVTARSLPCTRPHVWQTFAIAILPAEAATSDQDTVARNPVVAAVCSMQVLLASRRGAARQIPQGSWDIAVLPPDEAAFASGTRTYRCLAHQLGGGSPSTSEFGQQAGQGGDRQHGRGGPGSDKGG